MRYCTVTILLLGLMLLPQLVQAGENTPVITVGTQEVGLTGGYMLPHRLTGDHVTKQQGPAFMPSWMMTLTDPVGDSWYRGQVSLGAEMVYLQFHEPIVTHGIGFTPRIKYTFVALDRIRPYLEFAGGPFWTDLGGNIPEQGSEFNFVLTGGIGVSIFVAPHIAINAGYRFHHISDAGTKYPNLGLNASLPFAGFSFYF